MHHKNTNKNKIIMGRGKKNQKKKKKFKKMSGKTREGRSYQGRLGAFPRRTVQRGQPQRYFEDK